MGVRDLFLSLDGRIGRLQWWIGTIIVEFTTTGLLWFAGFPILAPASTFELRLHEFLINLLPFYPNFALSVKRLHDRDRPASAALPLFAALAVMVIWDLFGYLNETTPPRLSKLIFLVIILVIPLAYLVELGFRKGSPGPNRFGPGPAAGLKLA